MGVGSEGGKPIIYFPYISGKIKIEKLQEITKYLKIVPYTLS
jgi:hypothetical protein